MNWFRLKSCIKCQGDLAADNGDWLCLQCGTYYYTGLYELHPRLGDGPKIVNPGVPEQPQEKLWGSVTATASPAPDSPAPDSPAPDSMIVTAMAESAFLVI